MQATKDDRRRARDLARPLRARCFDDEDAVLEPGGGCAIQSGPNRRAPGEPDLARRERRRAQELHERCRNEVSDRVHPGTMRSYHPPMRLMLASASPRRAELLRAAGITFEKLVVDVDERALPGESAASYVRRLAMDKSGAAIAELMLGGETSTTAEDGRAGAGLPPAGLTLAGGVPAGTARGFTQAGPIVVLAADTAVVLDDEILGKPRDEAHAAMMLRRLSGRRHEVITGISVRTSVAELGCVEATTVEFAPLSDADVKWYVASGEGRDKAGAYAIQGLASRFIPRIEGSYSNVVGLPVAAVHDLLARIAFGPIPGYSDR